MNLYPGPSIDVGVTRTPQPAPAAPQPAAVQGLVFGSSATGPTVRLDADFFADRERVLALTARWSRDELYALGNVLVGEGDRRIEGELLELLRDEHAGPPGSPRVTHVEFVTDNDYPEGVYWHDRAIYVHVSGHVEPHRVDYDDLTQEQAVQYRKLRDLLADYSRADRPSHGDHLVVDLGTGEFERSGKWARA
ncbi:hypothetical protein [Streptomyces sp. NPDC088707]|uniref:hypothetical protein n=1 Tax=Streptomyces sp. NPDC088707 TaxID=3365871 RepID=UPI003828F1EF